MTIRIAVRFDSAGERRTLKAIRDCAKPHFDIHPYMLDGGYHATDAAIVGAGREIRFVARRLGRPIIVNFAGNSERTAPGIEKAAEGIVRQILERVTVTWAKKEE